MGDIREDLAITSFGTVLSQYIADGTPRYSLAKVKAILGADEEELSGLRSLLERTGAAKLETIKTATCGECGRVANVENASKGILRCERGDMTAVDPQSLVVLSFDNAKVLGLVQQLALKQTRIEIPAPDIEELLPFSALRFYLVGRARPDELRIAVLLPLKKIELREACILLGFLAFMSEHVFLVISDSVSEDARSLLSYKSNGAVQLLSLNSFFEDPAILDEGLKAIPSGISGEMIRLASWIREKFQTLKSVVSPDTYKKIIEYDDQLVNESFHAATHGDRTKLEDCVAALFSSVLPTTQLGHALSGVEVPDGISIVPKKPAELVFYDCKSVGSEKNEEKTKSISQTDEDEFKRYVDLFRAGPEIPANLVAGCFVANDFAEDNMLNKARQLRQRVPSGVKIVFLPLSSLVKLYTKVTTDRLRFETRYRAENHFEKLLGVNLSKEEAKRLEADPRFVSYSSLRDLGVDAVFVTESLVDVFLEEVWKAPSMDQSFMPFVIDRARRASTRA